MSDSKKNNRRVKHITMTTEQEIFRVYNKVKKLHQDNIIIVREGFSYFTYNKDAKKVAEACKDYSLCIKHRSESKHSALRLIFASMNLDKYLSKIILAGHKVGFVDM